MAPCLSFILAALLRSNPRSRLRTSIDSRLRPPPLAHPALPVGTAPHRYPRFRRPALLAAVLLAGAFAWAGQRDLDGDGDPDLLETTWNGHKVVWIDDDDTMKWGATAGDMAGDCVMIDVDGDGRVDGPGDMAVKWVDENHDGKPDWQIIAMEERPGPTPLEHSRHWMIFQDVDQDGVLGYIDWATFSLDCWAHTGSCNFLPDYNGDSLFLKLHGSPSKIDDLSLNWENPFAFYDLDGDGCTEMAIRLCDIADRIDGRVELSGRIHTAYVAMDIDNDSGPGNEMDYDFTLFFDGGDWDYKKWVHQIPAMRGLPETDDLFPLYKPWRTLTELRFVPHDRCYDEVFSHEWKRCYFVFDEDDDDHRWERVELYRPTIPGTDTPVDPWSLDRGGRKSGKTPGLCSNGQSDSIGDRGEFDTDCSGRGQLYFSPLDAKLHLYGAEWGAWTLDDGTHHGGSREPTDRPDADKLMGVVIYRDSDHDGFFDTIQCDWNSDRKFDQTFSTAGLGPEADRAPVWNPATLKYAGIKANLDAAVNAHWQGLLDLYQACERAGIPGVHAEEVRRKQTQSQRLMSAWQLRLAARAAILRHLETRENMAPDRRKTLAAQIDRLLLLGQCAAAATLLDTEL